MANDDTSLRCPRCGAIVKIASIPFEPFKPAIRTESLYCSSGKCEWEENWDWNDFSAGFIKRESKDKSDSSINRILGIFN